MAIYEKDTLIKCIKSEDKTSQALPHLFQSLLKQYKCKNLYFVKGPGSFMAIKISYIYLKTLSITLNIPLLACEGFQVNGNQPIKAYGKLFFVKENGKIVTKKYEKSLKNDIIAPKNLKDVNFTHHIEPLYVLPAI